MIVVILVFAFAFLCFAIAVLKGGFSHFGSARFGIRPGTHWSDRTP